MAAVLGRPGGQITEMLQTLNMHDSIMTSSVTHEEAFDCDTVCH